MKELKLKADSLVSYSNLMVIQGIDIGDADKVNSLKELEFGVWPIAGLS